MPTKKPANPAKTYTTFEACGYIVVVEKDLSDDKRAALIAQVCAGAPAKALKAAGVVAILEKPGGGN